MNQDDAILEMEALDVALDWESLVAAAQEAWEREESELHYGYCL